MPNMFDIDQYYWMMTRQVLARDELAGSLFSHGTLRGGQSEHILREFIRETIPPQFRVETGQIVSSNGALSPQTDLIIFKNERGAVIGATESGERLIRLDAVAIVIEVKRSISINTIENIQLSAKTNYKAFMDGSRSAMWHQWVVAFRSTKTVQQVLRELNASFSRESVGQLLVLDMPPGTKELKEIFASTTGGKKTLSAAALQRFVAKIREPRGVLFIRGENKYRALRQRRPALIKLVSSLEHDLERVATPENMRSRDFVREKKKASPPSTSKPAAPNAP